MREPMRMPPIVIDVVCALGVALSLKSIVVLGRQSPWTSAGWWLTIAYLAAAIAKVLGYALPAHLEYVALVALTVAFVVAGVRDERQAEPWWWPNRCGASRRKERT